MAAQDDQVLDDARVAELLALAGRAELLEIFESFLTEAAARISALEAALQGEDEDAARRHAHALKGAAANLGAARFATLCEVLERHGASAPESASRASSLRHELSLVMAAAERL